MKILYVVRHGQASKAKKNQDDLARTLSKTGRKQVRCVASKLQAEGIAVDHIVSSSAPRAMETALILAEKLAYDTKRISSKESLYKRLTPAEGLADIRGLDDQFNNVMLVGHAPNLEELAAELVRGASATSIPAGGIVCLTFKSNKWSGIAKGSAQLAYIDFPKDSFKSKVVKQTRSQLQETFTDSLLKPLAKVDAALALKFRKQAAGLAKKLAHSFSDAMTSIRLVGPAAREVLITTTTAQNAEAARKARAKAAAKSKPANEKAKAKTKAHTKTKAGTKTKAVAAKAAAAAPQTVKTSAATAKTGKTEKTKKQTRKKSAKSAD